MRSCVVGEVGWLLEVGEQNVRGGWRIGLWPKAIKVVLVVVFTLKKNDFSDPIPLSVRTG